MSHPVKLKLVAASIVLPFETPAVRALQRWKFRPGRKNGKAVNTRVAQVVNFNIEDYRAEKGS